MTKKLTDDSKVFDVAKPGKGKIVTTSRPFVSPLVADSVSKAANAETTPSEAMTPSAPRKVIQPITVTDNSSEPVPVKTLTEEMEKAIDESTTEPLEEAEGVPGTKTAIELGPPKPESKPRPDIAPPAKKPEEKSEPISVPEPVEEPVTETENSEAASVDILAKEAEDKKNSGKNDEEQQKRYSEVQTLIDSKKYVVPISHGLTSASKKSYVGLLFLLIILFAVVGAYFIADAADWRWFGDNKQADSADNVPAVTEQVPEDDPATEVDVNKATPITDKEVTDPTVENSKQYKDKTGYSFSYPTNWKRYQRNGSESTWIATNDYTQNDSGIIIILTGGQISMTIVDTIAGTNAEMNSSEVNDINELSELRKNDEIAAYFDTKSVEIVEVAGKKAIRYNSGHTSDGVTYEWLINGKILQISYSTKGGDPVYGDYKKEASYPNFVKLIESVKF
ncbi:MAG: hypothetical protein M3Q14_00350 [bacterium]|nr:hypothetical protein [bacterium]